MPVKEPGKKASFMVICRTNYFNDIRPADPQSKTSKGYMEAVAVAQTYFAANQQEVFQNYLVDAKYLADLWAAHLVVEYGSPDPHLLKKCLEVIERYATSPFDPALAQQEQGWLKAYSQKSQAS